MKFFRLLFDLGFVKALITGITGLIIKYAI